MELSLMKETLAIHRLAPTATIPDLVYSSPFLQIVKTRDELTLVVADSLPIKSDRCERNWCCFEVRGPLDFSLTGILAELSAVLAGKGISIFAVSSFDTDYLLVRKEKCEAAIQALEAAGHLVGR
jgi:hypothetical protein